MKQRFLSILAVVLMATGAMAQKMIVMTKGGETVTYKLSNLDCVLFEEANPDEHEWVDLGLPSGTLWATCNVGANSPEDYGGYFAWGEAATKEGYSWGNYQWMNEGQSAWQYISKYTFADGQTDGCWYSGSTFIGDNKTELDLSDDAAFALWGSQWRMPSKEQFDELIDKANTTSEWTAQNGVTGCKITSRSNGESIFLPATGYFGSSGVSSTETSGNYWTRTLGTSYCDRAYELFIRSQGAYCTVSDRYVGQSIRPVRKGHDYVDLELPSGTLWATCNVGADAPEEYGDYFAWGETEPQESYTWETYKWCEGTEETMTKYCRHSEYGYNGFTDDLTELLPEDDAATANWGSQWQMPSEEQVRELINEAYTTTEWATLNGVNGLKITSISNGKSIFLPNAGDYWNSWLWNDGVQGSFWSRSILRLNDSSAYYFYFRMNDGWRTSTNDRCRGKTVRPVRKK